MMELRFHKELYDGFAIDEAAKIYGAYGTMDLERTDDGFIVRLTISPDALAQGIDEQSLASETANYALGKTIENLRAAAETASATTAEGAAK
jgi:hypothetical protein